MHEKTVSQRCGIKCRYLSKKSRNGKRDLFPIFKRWLVSIETIRNKINDRTSFDLFEYAEKYIENLRKNQKHATYKKYKSVIKKLHLYVGKETLPIKSISLDFIKHYEKYKKNHNTNNSKTPTDK